MNSYIQEKKSEAHQVNSIIHHCEYLLEVKKIFH